jgi:CHASE2 domain-containing sensor protein
MFLTILALFALAFLISPIVGSNPTFGGDAPLGLLAIGAVAGLCANVLWERNRNRQQIAGVLLIAGCLIIAGIVGLRSGGPWSPIGTAFLVVGVLGAAAAALLAWSELVEATGDPAT